jgi:hypothetical protein
MSIHVEMSPQEIAALKQFTNIEDESEAVTQAAREFIRLSRLRELKTVCGKVEIENNWQELENLELGAHDFPE